MNVVSGAVLEAGLVSHEIIVESVMMLVAFEF